MTVVTESELRARYFDRLQGINTRYQAVIFRAAGRLKHRQELHMKIRALGAGMEEASLCWLTYLDAQRALA